MAIAFDATSHSRTASGSSLTLAHTCTGSDRALVVCVIGETGGGITGVTYAGVAMTLVLSKSNGGAARTTYFYYLNAPASGTNNIVASASGAQYIEVCAASYTGVAQSGQPEASGFTEQTSSTSLSASVTTATANAWAVMCAFGKTGTLAAGAGTTLRATDLVGGVFDSNAAIASPGATSLAFTQASSDHQIGIVASLAPVSSGTITISTPVQYKVHQRSGSTGSIAITGTYTGSPTAIEASFNGGAYSTIVASPSSGTFSGTLSSQTQGQGTLTVRFTNDTSVSATKGDIGIGDVFLVGGDSISEGRGTNAQSYSHATLKATAYNQSGNWINGNDPIDTGTANGVHWPLLATQIMADQGVPVAFVTVGAGSTDVAGTHNEWAKNNSGYSTAITQASNAATGGIRGVLLHLGPNAVVNASTPSKATYSAAITQLAADFAADLSGAPKTHIGVCGEVSTGSPPDRRAALDNIRGAIIDSWDAGGNLRLGPCLISDDYTDGVHPASDAELAVVAKRWWLAIRESIYGGASGRGPRLSSATWNTARTQITVAFDRALKTGLTFGAGAWIVKDNGSTMTISSIAYHGTNPNALVISTSAAATGPASSTTLTFGSGEDAKGLVVPLSTDITMPSGSAINIPAEPIYAATVGEYAIQPTGIASTEAFGTPTISLSTFSSADLTAIADAVGARVIEGGLTHDEVLRILLAYVAGNVSGGPFSPEFKSMDGAITRIGGAADAFGNRTRSTLDGS